MTKKEIRQYAIEKGLEPRYSGKARTWYFRGNRAHSKQGVRVQRPTTEIIDSIARFGNTEVRSVN